MQIFITRTVNWFIEQSRTNSIILGIVYFLVIGTLDYVTSYEFTMSLFYMLPISLFAWNLGRAAGIGMAVSCTAAQLLTEVATRTAPPHPAVEIWDAVIRFIIFIVFGLIISELKNAFDREKDSARRDFLTGLPNYQAFVEFSEQEIARAKRYHHPFTAMFIDCDNFKAINDTLGHQEGNMLLQIAATTLRKNIRATDRVARIGGDEFVVLLTETGFEAAGATLQKIKDMLHASMQKSNWPVTFSIGAISFRTPPGSFDEMIRQVDALLYAAKYSGKNRIEHRLAEDSRSP